MLFDNPISVVLFCMTCIVFASGQRASLHTNDGPNNGSIDHGRRGQEGGYLLLAQGAIEYTLNITVTNSAYAQPLSPFFVLVHDSSAAPVFRVGEPASEDLVRLAEFGDPSDLVAKYTSIDGAAGVSAAFQGSSAPLPPGHSLSFVVTVNRLYPLVSFASMAVNTNDMIVGVDSEILFDGITLTSPGYDAGTEENNEACVSIPGPACVNSTNVRSLNGEGYVHVHRGIHGTGDLDAAKFDWRNPVLHIQVSAI